MSAKTVILIGLAAAGSALLMPGQAAAQSASPVIVFGDDPCPRSSESNVVVCKRLPESDRLRLPEEFRPNGPLADRTSWTQKQKELEAASATGTNSCSAVGPGGQTGCLANQIRLQKKIYKDDKEAQTAPIK